MGLSLHDSDPLAADSHRKRAWTLLENLHLRGLYGGETLGGLARLAYANGDRGAALQLASESLEYSNLSPKTRVNCLFYVGQIGIRAGDFGPAGKSLEQLVALRWLSEDWNLLAAARQQERNLTEALRDMVHAVSIAPFRPDLRRNLAQLYQQQGDLRAAERELAIARRLAGEAAAKQSGF